MYRNAPHSASRPWWILDHHLEHNVDASDRWNETVCFPVPTAAATTATMLTKKGQVRWWSDELSKNQYDGVIGLSQGAAMAALLLSMVCSSQFPTPFIHIWESKTETICFSCVAQQSHERARLPSRKDSAHQIRDTLLRFSSQNFRIRFAHSLMRRSTHTGFISQREPHGRIYALPDNLPTLHSASSHPPLPFSSECRSDCLTPAGIIAVDMRDGIVPAQKTVDLQGLFKNSQLVTHNEGKSQTESLTSSAF